MSLSVGKGEVIINYEDNTLGFIVSLANDDGTGFHFKVIKM